MSQRNMSHELERESLIWIENVKDLADTLKNLMKADIRAGNIGGYYSGYDILALECLYADRRGSLRNAVVILGFGSIFDFLMDPRVNSKLIVKRASTMAQSRILLTDVDKASINIKECRKSKPNRGDGGIELGFSGTLDFDTKLKICTRRMNPVKEVMRPGAWMTFTDFRILYERRQKDIQSNQNSESSSDTLATLRKMLNMDPMCYILTYHKDFEFNPSLHEHPGGFVDENGQIRRLPLYPNLIDCQKIQIRLIPENKFQQQEYPQHKNRMQPSLMPPAYVQCAFEQPPPMYSPMTRLPFSSYVGLRPFSDFTVDNRRPQFPFAQSSSNFKPLQAQVPFSLSAQNLRLLSSNPVSTQQYFNHIDQGNSARFLKQPSLAEPVNHKTRVNKSELGPIPFRMPTTLNEMAANLNFRRELCNINVSKDIDEQGHDIRKLHSNNENRCAFCLNKNHAFKHCPSFYANFYLRWPYKPQQKSESLNRPVTDSVTFDGKYDSIPSNIIEIINKWKLILEQIESGVNDDVGQKAVNELINSVILNYKTLQTYICDIYENNECESKSELQPVRLETNFVYNAIEKVMKFFENENINIDPSIGANI